MCHFNLICLKHSYIENANTVSHRLNYFDTHTHKLKQNLKSIKLIRKILWKKKIVKENALLPIVDHVLNEPECKKKKERKKIWSATDGKSIYFHNILQLSKFIGCYCWCFGKHSVRKAASIWLSYITRLQYYFDVTEFMIL